MKLNIGKRDSIRLKDGKNKLESNETKGEWYGARYGSEVEYWKDETVSVSKTAKNGKNKLDYNETKLEAVKDVNEE